MEAERIEAAIEAIETELKSLDPDLVDRGSARRLLSLFARGERACAGGTALLARRVGDPSIVAREAGTSVGKARSIVGLSERLGDTPDLDAAVRGGALSLDQATEIAKAETAAPGSAEMLVEAAQRDPFHVLKHKARSAVLADTRVDLGERQRAARCASHHVTDLGLVHIEADLEPHIGTPIVERLEREARRLTVCGEGDEPWTARLADAFASCFGGVGSTASAKPELVVVVSHEVAARGWTSVEPGEACHVPGVGPVDPGVAKKIAEDAFITGVVRKGRDLRQMRRWTRSIPIEVRLALRLGRPPAFDGARCVDCGNRWGLEYDHDRPFSEGGPTSLDNLRPRCGRCHRRKTARDRSRRRSGSGAVVGERDPPRRAA